QSAPVVSERVKFERRVSATRYFPRLFGKAFRRARTAIPAVRISAQPLMAASAPKIVDRLRASLPDNVPTRNLDRGHRGHLDLCAVAIDVPDQPLRQQFHLERIDAQYEWL